jgi:hypothetical protein
MDILWTKVPQTDAAAVLQIIPKAITKYHRDNYELTDNTIWIDPATNLPVVKRVYHRPLDINSYYINGDLL